MQKVIDQTFQERVSDYSLHGPDAALKYISTSNRPQYLAIPGRYTLSDKIFHEKTLIKHTVLTSHVHLLHYFLMMFSLLATSWDSKERLIKSFPRALENIRIIEEVTDLRFIHVLLAALI